MGMIEARRTPTAKLNARFAGAMGQSLLADCFHVAPLKIAKTFALDTVFPGCTSPIGVCVMDASPGLLAGDDYEMAWQLEANTHVFITTQGFTRVHPSRERPCRLQLRIEVAEGALLEWFPEPLMLYRDASLKAECEIDIARGGTLFFSDITCAGRVGRGEAFQFHSFSNRMRVRYDNELIFISQTILRPELYNPRRPGAWGDWTHAGNFYVFAENADAGLRDLLRSTLDESCAVWGGISLLNRYGVAVSLLGRRAYDLQTTLQLLGERAREHLSGQRAAQSCCSG